VKPAIVDAFLSSRSNNVSFDLRKQHVTFMQKYLELDASFTKTGKGN
jgi:hypothetical protein